MAAEAKIWRWRIRNAAETHERTTIMIPKNDDWLEAALLIEDA